jgi:PhzF family phenazine biosynthesis protein
MRIPIYQVDAFSRTVFGGNPAAVCPLQNWLADAQMQSIAAENNLAETAFLVGSGENYDLRWFTPTTEVDLCGHATLASAFVICNHLNSAATQIEFKTRSGILKVRRDGELYTLDFPVRRCEPRESPPALAAALGAAPRTVFWAVEDYLAVFDSEQQIRALAPDFARLATVQCRGVIVTARGSGDVGFVSRFFAPRFGIPEDPVTGSAHCALIPYWSEQLGKTRLRARQMSARGGELWCELRGERVDIAGHVAPFLQGYINL